MHNHFKDSCNNFIGLPHTHSTVEVLYLGTDCRTGRLLVFGGVDLDDVKTGGSYIGHGVVLGSHSAPPYSSVEDKEKRKSGMGSSVPTTVVRM